MIEWLIHCIIEWFTLQKRKTAREHTDDDACVFQSTFKTDTRTNLVWVSILSSNQSDFHNTILPIARSKAVTRSGCAANKIISAIHVTHRLRVWHFHQSMWYFPRNAIHHFQAKRRGVNNVKANHKCCNLCCKHTPFITLSTCFGIATMALVNWKDFRLCVPPQVFHVWWQA